MKTQTGQSRNSTGRARWLVVLAVTLSVLASLGASKPAAKQATEFKVNGKVLKTAPAKVKAIAPLFEAIIAYDEETERNGDKPPKDARERLKKIQALAPDAKKEIASLAKRLKAAGEVEDFNTFIAGKVKETKSAALIAEFEAAGGDAFSVLLKADDAIDKDLTIRQKAADSSTGSLSDRFDNPTPETIGKLPGAAYTGMSLVLFAVTWGSATDFNYHWLIQ